MDDIITQTENFITYLRAMMLIAPALCSLVCVFLVSILMHDFQNSRERGFRIASIVFFLSVSALWLILFVFSYLPDLFPTSGAHDFALRLVRLSLTFVAIGIPTALLAVRCRFWLKRKRAGASDALSDSGLRLLAISTAITGAVFVAEVALAFPGNGKAWLIISAVVIPVQQVWCAHYVIWRQHPNNDKFTLRYFLPDGKNRVLGRKRLAERNEPYPGLTKRRLEEYFKQERPYLNPEFKLTDLAEAMEVNRSEISGFINRTFDMNFKRYVNRWRLVEYERLMALPSNEIKNPYRILPMAGFTDSRHYNRALEQEKEYEEIQTQ